GGASAIFPYCLMRIHEWPDSLLVRRRTRPDNWGRRQPGVRLSFPGSKETAWHFRSSNYMK
ncbi:hypothetical protein, partial [Aeromonas dhakensis]|uniref:hypothetical protein n=1 Tax=Aeromonas dhakensis TaxID=196024 RepID=UPI001BDEE253